MYSNNIQLFANIAKKFKLNILKYKHSHMNYRTFSNLISRLLSYYL